MVCLETSFLVDLLRGHDRAREVMDEIDRGLERPTVTPIAASELWVGAYLGSAAELESARELLESLAWLEVTRESAERAGRIDAALRERGDQLGFTDCLIAAIAVEYGETLVTADADFERVPSLDVRTY